VVNFLFLKTEAVKLVENAVLLHVNHGLILYNKSVKLSNH